MPSTLVGLLILAYILVPGYVYYLIRRSITPTPRISTFFGAVNFICIAILSNAATAMLLAVSRLSSSIREHSPDMVELIRASESYVLHSDARLAYVGGWALSLLGVSCGMAAALAYLLYLLGKISPIRISEESTWYYYFERQLPKNHHAIIECFLDDGVWISGKLDTFNPILDDSPDRELTLVAPLKMRSQGGEVEALSDHYHVIVSARRIVRLMVRYEKSTDGGQTK